MYLIRMRIILTVVSKGNSQEAQMRFCMIYSAKLFAGSSMLETV